MHLKAGDVIILPAGTGHRPGGGEPRSPRRKVGMTSPSRGTSTTTGRSRRSPEYTFRIKIRSTEKAVR